MFFKKDYHKELVQEIKTKALTKGDFTLASGVKSDYYIDLSKVVFSGRAGLVIEYIINSICLNNINKIGGPAIGAIPIIVGLMCRCDMEGFIIRKQEKEYGKKEVIEGCLDKGDNVVLVEDVTTSGNSLLKAVKVVQEFGCNVKQVISVLDRNQGAKELFEKENIPFKCLISINEVL